MSVSLPPIIIYEFHWDVATKSLLKELLSPLADLGYDTICLETDAKISSEEIIRRSEHNLHESSELLDAAEKLTKKTQAQLCGMGLTELSELMRQKVSSKQYQTVAESIKQLPAAKMFKAVSEDAQKLKISIQGVDINLDEIITADSSKRMAMIRNAEDLRIKTIFDNLRKLSEKGAGIVFICGVMHAANLTAIFKENKMKVLHYFPYSTKRFATEFDNIQAVSEACQTVLKGNIYPDADMDTLKAKIISDVKADIKKIEEGNSHWSILSKKIGDKYIIKHY